MEGRRLAAVAADRCSAGRVYFTETSTPPQPSATAVVRLAGQGRRKGVLRSPSPQTKDVVEDFCRAEKRSGEVGAAGKQGRKTAAAGVCHRRWKTGRDGDRSCHVLADCSMLTLTLCFDDAVAVRRRRRVTVTHLLRRCFSEPIAADHGEFESPLQLSGRRLAAVAADRCSAGRVYFTKMWTPPQPSATAVVRLAGQGRRKGVLRSPSPQQRMLSKTFAERRREAERFEPPACSASSIAGKQGRRTAAAGVCHRRWKTGRDGDRSCHVLADCSMLTPTLCFDDAVAVRRRRRVTVTHLLRRCFSEPIAADHGEFESPLQLSVVPSSGGVQRRLTSGSQRRQRGSAEYCGGRGLLRV
nr:hypothetical protein Iba_chr06cCG13090 [Ipomoea batatas]